MNIASRVHRTLEDLKWFTPGTESKPFVLLDDEKMLGKYGVRDENHQPEIGISDRGIHFQIYGKETFVPFEKIKRAEAAGEKTETTGVNLTLIDGSMIFLPIIGGEGRFRDAWSFVRFFDRVIADLQETIK